MWTSSRDEWLHNWRKESTTSSPCITVRTHRPAAAPAQLCPGKARPCPGAGKASSMQVPLGVVQILWIHGAVSSASTAMALQFSTAEDSSVWKEKGCRQMEPGLITQVHEQTSARSHSSFLWFPESQTAFSTNKQPSKATWEQAQAGHLPEGRTLYWKVRSH